MPSIETTYSAVQYKGNKYFSLYRSKRIKKSKPRKSPLIIIAIDKKKIKFVF